MATTKPRASSTPATVKVTAAKGRPMLTWVGKRPLTQVTAFPAQHVETFDPTGELEKPRTEEVWSDWPPGYPQGGLLFHGDNKEVLAHLLANGFRGKVNLIYIDPPFDSGADYVRRVSLRGATGTAKLDGEGYTLGEQIQYTDIWANDNYLQFMYERLLLLKELLAETGTIYLHCDSNRNYLLRALLDEAFGTTNFLSEIAWRRSDSHNDARRFGVVHDTILVYSKGDNPAFNRLFVPLSKKTRETWYRHREPQSGRRYNLGNLVSPHPRPNLMYEWNGIQPPAMGWRISKQRMEALDQAGLLMVVGKGSNQTLKVKQYLDESKGRLLTTWWDDISQIRGYGTGAEAPDFPTRKPEGLLRRIIEASSDPGDTVLDCFIGSGTTAAVAQKLGRRWIGCDINKGAAQTTGKRLQQVIEEQIAAGAQTSLGTGEGDRLDPSQLSFTTWRVNDYDLAIQHNEAVNLACEHIGVQRMRTDPYFDGTLGANLVKIVPFDHPLSPVDLEDLKRELDSRPEEDRSVTLVCLGIEMAARTWVEDWNRLRRGKNAVNRVEVIELRSDPKYGKFLRHAPARARLAVARRDGKLVVDIEDFVSPTIVERLAQQTGVVRPKIEDWRAMVDSVMIDTSYDGQVFNVALSDVPERKQDLVSGRYELPAPRGKTTVAVKITDMLGEEVIETFGV